MDRKEEALRKRWIGIVGLVAVFALIASGCAKKSTPAAGGSASASASPSFTTITPGFLTVGSCLDFAPFETVKNGQPTGFDVEMTDAIAAKLGFDTQHVKWVKANFNTIFTAVTGNQFDLVAAAVTATGKVGAKRAQTVNFSDFYYNSLQSLTVNTKATPTITSTGNLKSGDTVGVQKGTTGADWAITNLQPKGITIRTYTSVTDAFRDLEAGNTQGVVNDAPSSYAIAASMPGLKVVETIDTNEKYGFAFAKTNPQLLAAWNQGLKEVIADGEYAKIFAKYFPGTPVPPEFQAS